MGPRDAITGKARYTLDSSSLLQTEMTGKQIVSILNSAHSLCISMCVFYHCLLLYIFTFITYMTLFTHFLSFI